jgi:hypothetical protein
MELTTKQIQEIEHYLIVKKMNYVDVQIEVLDHIITDVEKIMETRSIHFEPAFMQVKLKWKKHFNFTSSFYFGATYSAPKIIVDKANALFKKFYFILISSYFLPFLFFQTIDIKVEDSHKTYIASIIYIVIILSISFFLHTYYKKAQLKFKTTYSFILKTQFFSLAFLLLPMLIGDFFHENGELNGPTTGLVVAFICSSITTRHFYQKHVSVISKYTSV